MEASDTTLAETPVTEDPIAVAASLMNSIQAQVTLTAPGGPGGELVKCVFPRLSLARRVLGHVCDEVDETAFGPRNTLAAITRSMMQDPHSTRPQNPECEALDITGTQVDAITQVHERLTALTEAGLLSQREDGSYERTEAGFTELQS